MMHQRPRLFALSVLTCFALGLSAQDSKPAQEAGPSEVQKVVDHFSKWDYPKEVNVPTGSQLYLVVKGDTLWDLGQSFLGNPFAWPQIWEQNKWIKDPHWIYPGDPLIIPVAKQTVAGAGSPAQASSEVSELRPDRPKRHKPIQEEFGFTFQDFIQMPYLGPAGAEAYFKEIGAFTITERKDQSRQFLGDGETVYLAGGADRGVKIGDRMVILKVTSRKLRHPDPKIQRKPMGDVVQQIGVLRVTTVNPAGSIAVIERSMDAVEVGFHAAPFVEPANMVAALRADVTGPIPLQEPTARILYARENHEHTATGEMIIIDRGTRDGLKVGDVLLAARQRTWPANEARKNKDRVTEQTTYYLGQVMVVRADPASASCRILRATEEMRPGDILTR